MSPEINIDGLEAQHLKGIFDQNGKALPEGFTTYVVTSPDGRNEELIAINLNTGIVIASSEMTERIKIHLQGQDIFSGNIPNHERIFDKPQEKPISEAAAPGAEKSDLEKKYENMSIFDIFIDEHNPRFGNAFNRSGVETVYDLIRLCERPRAEDHLLSMRNVGENTTRKAIKGLLQKVGTGVINFDESLQQYAEEVESELHNFDNS